MISGSRVPITEHTNFRLNQERFRPLGKGDTDSGIPTCSPCAEVVVIDFAQTSPGHDPVLVVFEVESGSEPETPTSSSGSKSSNTEARGRRRILLPQMHRIEHAEASTVPNGRIYQGYGSYRQLSLLFLLFLFFFSLPCSQTQLGIAGAG